MKVFISQPMGGRTEKEIIKEREQAIAEITNRYGRDTEVIDSYVVDEYRAEFERRFKDTINNFNIYWLGVAIELLSEADVIVMCGDWERSKGCNIEKICAEAYKIDTIYL